MSNYVLTRVELILLIEASYIREPLDMVSQARRRAAGSLNRYGLIEDDIDHSDYDNDLRAYKTTEKGTFMVKMLEETPVPVQQYVDPR